MNSAAGENGYRELLLAWLHLAVLWAFGLAQPLFEVLSDSPEFFVARGNTSGDIVILAVGVTLIPPTALIAIELALLPLPRVRRTVHLLFVAILVAAIALQVLKDVVGGSSPVLLPSAIALGLAAALAYRSTRVGASILTVLSPAPIVFLILFLVFSPVSKLVFPEDTGDEAIANVRGDTPVVFVVFDELSLASLMDSRGHIDAARFPNFARLARGSTWYRHATTVADETAQAVPAILTGDRIRKGALPIASEHPRNLFNFLRRDYVLDVEESVTKLCRASRCRRGADAPPSDRLEALVSDLSIVSGHLLLPRDLAADLPPVDQTFGAFGDQTDRGARAANAPFEDRHETFEDFVGRVRADPERPPLHFLHIQLPHVPWEYLPSGQRYRIAGDVTGLFIDLWLEDGPYARLGFQQYALQLGLSDHLLGRLLDRLRTTGLWERSLVVVAADHGVSFRPGKGRRHATRETIGDIAGVPLFIKAPGQRRGRIDDGRARTVDILPTIADHLGARLPWKADGRSLRSPPRTRGGPIRVDVRGGPTVSLPFAEYRSKLRAAALRLRRFLGPRGDLFASGADGDLVGRRVETLATAAPVDAQFDLRTPLAFKSVDPRGPLVPTLIEGRFTGQASAGERLAIVVNGSIRAVTRSYKFPLSEVDRGDVSFSAMVTPAAFRPGRNSVVLFRIEGVGAGRRLAPFGGSGETRLTSRAGRWTLVLTSGRRVPLSRRTGGHLDSVVAEDQTLVFSGWAADPSRTRVADRVFVFADGRLLVAGPPGVERPDVARTVGPALLRSGYKLRVATPRAKELSNPDRLRVVALSGDSAAELERPRR